ncbi:MAG: acyl-CoA dehydrogenase family protein [Rhizobiaceae bacterium]
MGGDLPEMAFEISGDLAELRRLVRRFVDTELIPIELTSCENDKVKSDVMRRLRAASSGLGLDRFDVPESHGGLGLGMLARVIVWEELGRTVAIPSRAEDFFGADVSPTLWALGPEQAEKYLLPTIAGQIKWCFAQTEAEAGSDPASMRMRAVRDGDHYVLDGVKRFITRAHEADFAEVVAVTDREKGSRGGISIFIVDMKAPGVKLLRSQDMMIDDRPWEVAFDHVRVPAENRVGEEGAGFASAQRWLSAGRLRHGAKACGVIDRCLSMAASYARQRVTFGEPLANRQAVQWMLVDAFMDLHQLRLMVHHAAAKYDRGEDIRVEAYMAKVFGDHRSFVAADNCMQIHGAVGLSRDLPIEKFWRDQRSMMITEGPNEVLKTAIARHVLREYS